MKKNAILFLGVLAGFGLNAQNASTKAPDAKTDARVSITKYDPSVNSKNKTAAVYWSEDFASGIPSTWSNLGNPVAATWEYRGPSTTPSNATGSRGAYSTGATPLTSPTVSNGFVIFDSDYLDNGGSTTGAGSGPAPTPHVGTLMTAPIDLSAAASTELKFHAKARQFLSDFWVAISVNGGISFVDTIPVLTELGVNSAHTNDIVTINIDNIATGQSNVVIAFIFNGDQSNPGQEGYYYWQIDDIEIRDLPTNELRFTALTGAVEAPANDIIYEDANPNDNFGATRYGTIPLNQVVPIHFDGNVYNYGSNTQDSVRLGVEIINANTQTVVTTVYSPYVDSLETLDTATFADFTTTSWTPTAVGAYQILYKAISANGTMAVSDTLQYLQITPAPDLNSPTIYGLDWTVDSYYGTNSSGSGTVFAAATRYSFPGGDPDSSEIAVINGVEVVLSALTDPLGELRVVVRDTQDFGLVTGQNGFGPSNMIYFDSIYSLAGLAGTAAQFMFDEPIVVPSDMSYFLYLEFYVSDPDSVIRIGNSQAVDQPSNSTIMVVQETGGLTYYAGFTSRAAASPAIRAIVGDYQTVYMGVDDVAKQTAFAKVYPNPSNGKVNLDVKAGQYTLSLMGVDGRIIRKEEVTINNGGYSLDHSDIKKGTYLLNISGETRTTTKKLIIE